MDINVSVLLPLLLLALGVFLVLKTNKPVWKIIGWVLVVIIALLFVFVSRVSS
ncbi:MAG TPA: hypothetical protein VEO19_05060 [Terriglobia bacterium]|nr:hypothetical protein [Terriglobia bacterium]